MPFDRISTSKLRQDLTGYKIGRWTVIRRTSAVGDKVRWLCQCECGNTRDVIGESLKRGTSLSCGCLMLEMASGHAKGVNVTHGMSNSSEYRSWAAMIQRCYTHSNPEYPRYGGRGIMVCDRWLHSFENFHADMGPKPSKNHSIDRIDNNLGYCPENCRWSTRTDQTRNRRTSRFLTHDGKTATIAEWSEITGISPSVIWGRLKLGWSVSKVLTEPIRKVSRNTSD